jgi:hypothetical protein
VPPFYDETSDDEGAGAAAGPEQYRPPSPLSYDLSVHEAIAAGVLSGYFPSIGNTFQSQVDVFDGSPVLLPHLPPATPMVEVISSDDEDDVIAVPPTESQLLSDTESEDLEDGDAPAPPTPVPGRLLGDTNFRFQGVKVGLTYSCPRLGACALVPKAQGHVAGCACANPILSADELVGHLTTLWGDCEYVVSTELHKSGKVHYHAYLKWDTKKDTANCHWFDFKGVHPNILVPFGNGKAWQAYVTKKGDFVSNFVVNNPFKLAMAAPTADAAVKAVFDSDPKNGVVFSNQIQTAWRIMNKAPAKPLPAMVFKIPFPVLGRTREQLLSAGINRKDDEYCLIIEGPAGIGKTEFALRIFPNGQCRLISHIDDLKSLDMSTVKAVVFDDMDFKHYPRSAQIHLCDAAVDRSIHCRYNNVVLPAGLVRIFTCNISRGISNVAGDPMKWAESGVDVNAHWPVDMTDAAIRRRVQILSLDDYSIDDPLF